MKCLKWKVIAGLGALGVGIYLVAPGVAAAAFALLVLACPLSMLLMMRAMGTMDRWASNGAAGPAVDADEVARLRAEVEALRAERQGR